MNAQNYKIQREELMEQWEKECREWIKEKCKENKIEEFEFTFFKDGIINPDVWFKNHFRPLFILIEPHDKKWSNRCIDFVAMEEGTDYDIWCCQGRGMWKALATLANGIISANADAEIVPYEEIYFGEMNNIINYREIIQQIAIINLKKAASGGRVGSDESNKTINYLEHVRKFKDKLENQIRMVEASHIILCGSKIGECFEIKDNKLYGIPVIKGLHPSVNSNVHRTEYYDDTISEFLNIKKNVE